MHGSKPSCHRGCKEFHEFAQQEATSVIGSPLATVEELLFAAVTRDAKFDALEAELQTSSLF